MIFDWICADDDRHIGVFNLVKGRGDRPGANVFHQGRDAGGVAQAGAVIHIVVPKALSNELLEKIGFLIGAFCRTKASDRGAAVRLLEFGQTTRGKI